MKFKIFKFQIEIPYPLLLLLAALISFWQFSTFSNVLRFDIQDGMYPWRYFAGECFQNGIFPLWNPYEQYGYPFYADLQYTNWNPEVWLIGNLIGYSYAVIYLLIIFYVWMAGLGMYKLANYLTQDNKISFFVALIWMLSGCTISHMQQFVTVIGIAWMPFVVWQFFAFTDTWKWRHVIGFGVFSFLFFTSGYQALYFMLFYFFIIVFAYRFWLTWRSDRKKVKIVLIRSSALVILMLILLMPVFVVLYRTSGLVTRLDHGVTLIDANLCPFTPQSLISLLLPVVSVKMQDFISTDITMSNVFIGIIPLIFLTASFFSKKNILQIILIVFAILYLLASFGEFLPVRKWFYDYVPLMNLFRLAGLFRVVAVFLILVHLSIYLKSNSINNKFFFYSIGALILIYSCLLIKIVYFTKFNDHDFTGIHESLFRFFNRTPGVNLILLQILVYGFLLILILVFHLIKRNGLSINFLTFSTFLFLFFGIQFNVYLNVAGDQSPAYISRKEKTLPKKFPLPTNTSIKDYTERTDKFHLLYANSGNLLKKPMNDPFSSFQLDGYVYLNDSLTGIKDFLFNKPLAYLSDTIIDKRNWKLREFKRACSFINLNSLNKTKFQCNQYDKIKWIKFRPNHFKLNVENKSPVIFNLQQAWFPGWKIMVNGMSVNPLLNANYLTSITLNSGINKIELLFEDVLFMSAYFMSISVFFLLLFLMLYSSGSSIYKYLGVIILFFFITNLLLFGIRKFSSDSEADLPSSSITINNGIENSAGIKNYFSRFQFDDSDELKNLTRFYKESDSELSSLKYEWKDNSYDNKLAEMLRMYYPNLVGYSKKDGVGKLILNKNGNDNRILKEFSFKNINDTSFFKCENGFRLNKNEKKICPEIYIPTHNFSINDSNFFLVKFKLFSKVKSNCKIYFQIESGHVSDGVWFQSYNLNSWVQTEDQSNEVVIPFIPEWNTYSDSRIRIFFTTENNSELKIEDLKLIYLKNDLK
ncbi:MAG: hypothetical protein ACK5D5_04810 [Bacteroidota bacterium]|jgi:hypothetical protein